MGLETAHHKGDKMEAKKLEELLLRARDGKRFGNAVSKEEIASLNEVELAAYYVENWKHSKEEREAMARAERAEEEREAEWWERKVAEKERMSPLKIQRIRDRWLLNKCRKVETEVKYFFAERREISSELLLRNKWSKENRKELHRWSKELDRLESKQRDIQHKIDYDSFYVE